MKVPTGFSIVVFEGSMGTLLSAIDGMLCARWWGPEISGITSFAFNLASTFSFLACLSIEQFVIARFVTGRNLDYLFMATVVLRAGALTLSLFGVVPIKTAD